VRAPNGDRQPLAPRCRGKLDKLNVYIDSNPLFAPPLIGACRSGPAPCAADRTANRSPKATPDRSNDFPDREVASRANRYPRHCCGIARQDALVPLLRQRASADRGGAHDFARDHRGDPRDWDVRAAPAEAVQPPGSRFSDIVCLTIDALSRSDTWLRKTEHDTRQQGAQPRDVGVWHNHDLCRCSSNVLCGWLPCYKRNLMHWGWSGDQNHEISVDLPYLLIGAEGPARAGRASQ
jgi:hypothetical protein